MGTHGYEGYTRRTSTNALVPSSTEVGVPGAGRSRRSASSSATTRPATTRPGKPRTSIRSKRFATSSEPMRTLPSRARVLPLVVLLAGGCAVGPDFVRPDRAVDDRRRDHADLAAGAR